MGAGEFHGYWIQRLDFHVDPAGNVSFSLTKYRYKNVGRRFIEQRKV
jgi:hypothetical protein